jgi:hypothetical protein
MGGIIRLIFLPKKRIIFEARLERGEHIGDAHEISFSAQAVAGANGSSDGDDR